MRQHRIAAAVCLAVLTYPAASRAEERIAFDHIAADGTEDIYSIRPDGGGLIKVTTTPAGQGGSELPEWGPLGRRILFDSDRAGGVHLFAADPDGSHVRQLTHSDGLEYSGGFSPDGRTIAFERDDPNGTLKGIYLMDRLTGDFATSRQLTTGPDTDPKFSPDGRTLAFIRVLSFAAPTAQSAVFVVGRDGRGIKQLTPFTMNAMQARWSADGRQLLFSSNADNGTYENPANLYLIGADGRGLTQLTHDSTGGSWTPAWSPDGTRIVYTHWSPTGLALTIMDLATHRTRAIFPSAPGTLDQSPAWTR